MAYPFPQFYNGQPFPYQDQLSQLRNAPMQIPGYQVPSRSDPNGLNWVQGESGAKSWIVTPGSTVLLMDSETMRFYIKSADLNGVPSMRTFEYAEINQQKPSQPAETPVFVTEETFNEFREDVLRKLESLSEPEVASSVRKAKKGESHE